MLQSEQMLTLQTLGWGLANRLTIPISLLWPVGTVYRLVDLLVLVWCQRQQARVLAQVPEPVVVAGVFLPVVLMVHMVVCHPLKL